MTDAEKTTRPNMRRRTRKDLLQAAARLSKLGRTPSLEEIAEEAMVSRATAYRYFPSVDALLLEASVDLALPDPVDFFKDSKDKDPISRLLLVDTNMQDMIVANEAPLRMMLINSLQRVLRGGDNGEIPVRQNRRSPLIDAALEPGRTDFDAAELQTLSRALAMVIGTEAMIVCKDVLQLDDAEARRVKSWAIKALVEAAKRPKP